MEKHAQKKNTFRKFFGKKWVKITLIVLAVLALGGGVFAWKTGSVLNKISGGKGNLLGSLIHSLPGVEEKLEGQEEGQVNIALLGMRGENMAGGALLTDTIIVISIRPEDNKISMISVPRDLYVTVPGTQDKQKINAVHAYGEQKDKGQGLEDMKTVLSEITGLNVAYASSINFEGFTRLIDGIGGITIHLDQPFSESLQFRGVEQRCDGVIYTVPSGNFEEKRIQRKNGTYYDNPKRYPMCYAKQIDKSQLECDGNFQLPAGDVALDGEKALCLARSRVTSSDFERARRQQMIIQAIKDKLMSAGTLTDFGKMNEILNNLGDNVRTDMQAWEMKKFYELYMQMSNPEIFQKVLENSEEGLLYHPENGAAGYILLPRGDNYDRIHEMVRNIFPAPAQSE